MSHHLRSAAALVPILAICCNGGSVARFAPCGSTDTCPSSTACESPLTTSATVPGPTMCTWSCNNNDFDSQPCPKDENGVEGTCVVAVNGTQVGGEGAFGFCFQDCSTGQTCPTGETCQAAQPYGGGSSMTMVCVPTPTDALAGTSWQSTTIVSSAMTAGVSSSTYTITFGPTTETVQGLASGSFNATLTLVYGATAFNYSGCTETTTFSGGAWVDLPPGPMNNGAVAVSNAMGTTSRTGCSFPSDDMSGVMGVYDDAVNGGQGAGYRISAGTMTMGGGEGVTPYSDQVNWTFTMQ